MEISASDMPRGHALTEDSTLTQQTVSYNSSFANSEVGELTGGSAGNSEIVLGPYMSNSLTHNIIQQRNAEKTVVQRCAMFSRRTFSEG